MTQQREFYRINETKQIVQGVFYVQGKRVWRMLCLIEQAEFGPNGNRRSDKQRSNFLAGLYAELEKQLGVDGPVKRRAVAVKVAFQNWIDLARGIQAERTITEHYTYTANLFVELVGNFSIRDISVHHMDQFVSKLMDRGLANSTINVRLASLKTFLRWAQERGYLQKIPKIKMLPTTRKLPKTFTDKQIVQIFAHIRNKQNSNSNSAHRRQYLLHERFLVLVGHTGARLSEIMHLAWNQIDFGEREIRILKQGGFNVKERQEKVIPMNESLQDYLRAWRATEPTASILFGKESDSEELMWKDYHGVTVAITRHLKELGLHGIAKPLHSFRARFATMLINQGRDISTVQALLGHQNIQTTQGYLSGTEPAKRAAVEGISLPI